MTQLKEIITVFNSEKTKGKVPVSPYNDNTFVFTSYECNSNMELFNIMVSKFILNLPLTIDKPVKSPRRKSSLGKLYGKYFTYIVLDIDGVKSRKNMLKITNFFKDYKVILGQSRSFNGIDCYNMKGVLFTNRIATDNIKTLLSELNHLLQKYCNIDESTGRLCTLNAPILKHEVIMNNEDGERYVFEKKTSTDLINEIREQYLGDNICVPVRELSKLKATSITNLCLQSFKLMGFEAIKNNGSESISFKHPSEHKTPGGYFWFSSSPYTMHHFNSTKTINIFNTIRKLKNAKELMRDELDYDDDLLNFNTNTNILSVNEQFLKISSEVKTIINSFLYANDPVLSIRSPMGTGKSTIINKIIEESHSQDMCVLVITNRISVAKDFGKKYNIKVYNEDNYEFGDSLVCQFDSLWKYNIKMFDVVIMDEFISLLLHSRSNLNNPGINIAKFFGSFNKKLVIADAFLTGYENFLLDDKENHFLIDNTYRDETALFKYENLNMFNQVLMNTARKHKITVSSTSIAYIESLRLLLNKKGLNVVTLTADTPRSTKSLIYSLFEQDSHDKWDVLIFSPTLTVGVSNLNDVKYHFHYDSSMSSDAISSVQMIKRTRKSEEIHMFIKDRINYVKTTYDSIRDDYMICGGKNINDNYMFEVDDYGEARLSKIGSKSIKIDVFSNILEFNHAEAMKWLMKYHFANEPNVIKDIHQENVLTKYKNENKMNKEAKVRCAIDEYLTLNEIEKGEILNDYDADKTLLGILSIDSRLLDIPKSEKIEIINIAIKDSSFISKCEYYKNMIKFCTAEFSSYDIRYIVSESIKSNDADKLKFYTNLLEYGQKLISDNYIERVLNTPANKCLRYIVNACGYKLSAKMPGARYISADENVKRFYRYIK